MEFWREAFGDLDSPAGEEPHHSEFSIPLFVRATGGHSLFFVALERMCMTYEMNAIHNRHGPLVHATNMPTLKASMSGFLQPPPAGAGLTSFKDYGMTRMLPIKRAPQDGMDDRIPHWADSRPTQPDGELPAPYISLRNRDEPDHVDPTSELAGTFLVSDLKHLWRQDKQHRLLDGGQLVLFNPRIATSFPMYICCDGTVVTQQPIKWTLISKIVGMIRSRGGDEAEGTAGGGVDADSTAAGTDTISWTVNYNSLWSEDRIDFDPFGVLCYLQADELLRTSVRHDTLEQYRDWPTGSDDLPPAAVIPWRDDGRYICFRLHNFRSGWGICPGCLTMATPRRRGHRRNYLEDREQRAMLDVLRRRGLEKIAEPPYDPDIDTDLQAPGQRLVGQTRINYIRDHKASFKTSEDTQRFYQHQRAWARDEEDEDRGKRIWNSRAGKTFFNGNPASVPAYVAHYPDTEPPIRNEPYFRFLQPLLNRFKQLNTHMGNRESYRQWWPAFWKLVDQYERPYRCLPLEALTWPDQDKSDLTPMVEGQEERSNPERWNAWMESIGQDNVPTPARIMADAEARTANPAGRAVTLGRPNLHAMTSLPARSRSLRPDIRKHRDLVNKMSEAYGPLDVDKRADLPAAVVPAFRDELDPVKVKPPQAAGADEDESEDETVFFVNLAPTAPLDQEARTAMLGSLTGGDNDMPDTNDEAAEARRSARAELTPTKVQQIAARYLLQYQHQTTAEEVPRRLQSDEDIPENALAAVMDHWEGEMTLSTRPARVLNIVRNLIGKFQIKGAVIGYPFGGDWASTVAAWVQHDAHCLDREIRAAVYSSDILESVTENLGDMTRTEARRSAVDIQMCIKLMINKFDHESALGMDTDEAELWHQCVEEHGQNIAHLAWAVMRAIRTRGVEGIVRATRPIPRSAQLVQRNPTQDRRAAAKAAPAPAIGAPARRRPSRPPQDQGSDRPARQVGDHESMEIRTGGVTLTESNSPAPRPRSQDMRPAWAADGANMGSLARNFVIGRAPDPTPGEAYTAQGGVERRRPADSTAGGSDRRVQPRTAAPERAPSTTAQRGRWNTTTHYVSGHGWWVHRDNDWVWLHSEEYRQMPGNRYDRHDGFVNYHEVNPRKGKGKAEEKGKGKSKTGKRDQSNTPKGGKAARAHPYPASEAMAAQQMAEALDHDEWTEGDRQRNYGRGSASSGQGKGKSSKR